LLLHFVLFSLKEKEDRTLEGLGKGRELCYTLPSARKYNYNQREGKLRNKLWGTGLEVI